jgi:ATP synthase protein I
MVPYQRPIPEKRSSPGTPGSLSPQQAKRGLTGGSGFLGAWVQAEKMIQMALVLPCAAFIGWAIGAWLDHLLHQTWIAMAGIVFGIISGLVTVVRMVMVHTSGSEQVSKNGNGAKKGNSGTTS